MPQNRLPKQEFLSSLTKKARQRGVITEIQRNRLHWTISLNGPSVVERIAFVLASRQEISPAMARHMLSNVSHYLAQALSAEQREFGLTAQQLLREAFAAFSLSLVQAQAPESEPVAAEEEKPWALRKHPPFPLRGADAQRDWYLSIVPGRSETGLPAQIAGTGKASGQHASALHLQHHDKHFWPDFQFDKDHIRPIVREILTIFEPNRSPWQIAFWFVSANSWLDGAAPIDRLGDDAALRRAAINAVNAVIA